MSPQTTGARRRAVGRGAPGRVRVPRAARERQMLAVATEMFARRGYEASMDEIARAAGISKPMLYSYFGSKEGLFAACARSAAAGLRAELESVVMESGRAADELFHAGLMAVFNFVERNREPWLVLYPEAGVGRGPFGAEAAAAGEAMIDLLARLFREVAEARGVRGDALSNTHGLARALTAATLGVASDWARKPSEPKELVVLRLMNFAWMGFGDLLEGRLWLPGQRDSA
jgi:AcrR family transcriptional regulator